jgi:hypothetical protein
LSDGATHQTDTCEHCNADLSGKKLCHLSVSITQ